ncbi:SDR family NAD(P)-dependent oxidoreductase [Synechococcus sp. CS-1328]|uniref:SDR family NAD(P)-dependent oxidoreductase n=1 Tax=Synechococcus sp. CS-1328 TaxID=2847976 RepID=UPI0037DA49C4
MISLSVNLSAADHIVTVGSVAGQRAFRGNSLYNASKSAVTMLTRSAAAESACWGCGSTRCPPDRS